jgi:hypothetical protein
MTNVTLKDFIAETLKSISSGVREAQKYSKAVDGIPIAIGHLDGRVSDAGEQMVKFSISLQAETSNSKSGTVGLAATVISVVTGNISVSGEAAKTHNTVHNIEFSVPLQFNAFWAKEALK